MLALAQSGLGTDQVPTRARLVALGAARDPRIAGAGRRFRAALETRQPDGHPTPFVFVPYDVFDSTGRESGWATEFHMTGAALDGTRVHLRLRNVPIDFYVEIPVAAGGAGAAGAAQISPSAYADAVRAQLRASEIRDVAVELVEGMPRTEYAELVRPYVRVIVRSTYQRQQAINAIKSQFRLFREDAGRDKEAYWRKICREHDLTCTNPLIVKSYEWTNRRAAETYATVLGEDDLVAAGGNPAGGPIVALGEIEIVVDGPGGMSPLRPAFASDAAAGYADLLEKDWEPEHHRRRGVGLFWDIETYKPLRDGAAPMMTDPTAETFMIGLSIAFEEEDDPVWRGVLTVYDYDDSEGGCSRFDPAVDGPGPQVQKILCPSEYAVACAFGRIIERVRPDYVAGFNDSDYDWPALLEILGTRHESLNALGHFEAAISSAPLRRGRVQSGADVRKWQAGGTFFKVTPDLSERLHFLRVPGIIPIDLRMVYWKMFNKAEKKSLNFFLKLAKLPPKDDMNCPEGLNPYEYMFRIVEAAKAVRAEDGYPGVCAASPAATAAVAATRAPRRTPAEAALPDDRTLAQQMGAVAKYCVIDAESCHRLLRRKKVLAEKREVGDMSFTCLYECLYRADGVRVLNLLAHFETVQRAAKGLPELFGSCASRDVEIALRAYADSLRAMGITNREELRKKLMKEMKYPGAWVFDVSCKLIERELPVTGLDFSSLYPSIIMALCLSPDRSLVGDRGGKTAAEIHAMEETARARAEELKTLGYTVHEVSFPFPVKKSLRGDVGPVRDWFVRARPDQDLNRNDGRGLYPEILIDLFGRRKRLKKTRLNPLAHELEELDLISAWATSGETPEGLKELASSVTPQIARTMREAAERGVGNLVPAAIEARIAELSATDEGGGDSSGEEDAGPKDPPKFVRRLKEILAAGHRAAAGSVSRLGTENPAAVNAALHEAWRTYLFEVTSETDRKHSDVDLKQKALKVFMNTFYGVAGNKTSPLFFMTVAGGTTTAGRGFIQLVARFVTERGNKVHYGDTDSVYISCDPGIFLMYAHAHSVWIDWQTSVRAARERGMAEPSIPPAVYYAGRRTRAAAARKFFGARELTDGQIAGADVATLEAWGFRPMSRERFWTKKVWATMRQLAVEKEAANAMLRAHNGTDFLKLAYEEVLFPVVFTGKKKYFGIAHEGIPNFRPRKLFVRGIDVIKQGQTGLAKKVAFDIMWRAVSVDETRQMRDLVEERVRDAVLRPEQWKFKDFIRTDTYKPDKQNIPVQTFVRRMKARFAQELAVNAARAERNELPLALIYEPPAPADKFEYVVVLPKRTHTFGGLKIDLKKGDMMEFASVVGSGPGMGALNLMYYMEKTTLGTCARLIGGSDIFALLCRDAETAQQEAMGLAGLADEDLSLEDVKEISKAGDDAVFLEAKKHLMVILRAAAGEDTSVSGARLGAAYRAAGKTVLGSFQAGVEAALGPVGKALAVAATATGQAPPDEEEPPSGRLLMALHAGARDAAGTSESLWLTPDGRMREARKRASAPFARYWCDPTVRIGALRRAEMVGEVWVAETARFMRVALRVRRDDALSATGVELAELAGSGVNPLDITCQVLESVLAERRQEELKRMDAKDKKDKIFDEYRPHIRAIDAAIKAAADPAAQTPLRQQKKELVARRRAQAAPHASLLKELEAKAKAPIATKDVVEALGAAGLTQGDVESLGDVYRKLVAAELPIIRKERADVAVMELLAPAALTATPL